MRLGIGLMTSGDEYKIIMDDAMTFLAHHKYFQDLANLFKALIKVLL